MNELIIKQLIAAIASLSILLTNVSAKLEQRGFVLERTPLSDSLILGAASGSGNFPTSSLNNFQDGDTINAADWNAIENKLGVNNSQVTTSLDWILKASTSTDPGHKHTTGTITGIGYVRPISEGGTNTSTFTYGVVIASSTNDFTTIAPGIVGNVLKSNGSGWISSSTSAQTNSIPVTAAIALNQGDAVWLYGGESNNVATTTTMGVGNNSCDASNCPEFAQSFSSIVTSTIYGVRLRIQTAGSPANNFTVKLEANSTSTPTGTTITSSTAANSTFTSSFADYSFVFNQPQILSASTTYWLAFSMDGAHGVGNNFYQLAGTSLLTYSRGTIRRFDDTNWLNGATATSSYFATISDSRALKAHAVAGASSTLFAGFSDTSIANQIAGTVTVGGLATSLTNLITGATYYLSNTAGSITVASNTLSVVQKVGRAMSSSSLVIIPF